jgi:hypothetical protein
MGMEENSDIQNYTPHIVISSILPLLLSLSLSEVEIFSEHNSKITSVSLEMED